MDTVHSAEENSMESVENRPCDGDDVNKPSSALRSGGMSDALDLNYSNQAQQSSFVQPAAETESNAREIGGSSMNGGEEVLNAETTPASARDQLSLGVSGGSVGMGASHEAEIHGTDIYEHKTGSVDGDADPIPELIETMGHTGESAPGPVLMDESAPEEGAREDPHGDSQDMASRLAVRADSGSKICGSTKADSVESGEKTSHAVAHENSAHPSLSCNARVYSGIDASKEEVTGVMLANDDYDPTNGLGTSTSSFSLTHISCYLCLLHGAYSSSVELNSCLVHEKLCLPSKFCMFLLLHSFILCLSVFAIPVYFHQQQNYILFGYGIHLALTFDCQEQQMEKTIMKLNFQILIQ
jgi:hypothetical protein